MANFEDLKERIKSEVSRVVERIQESSTFNQVRDRFENLSPIIQKLIIVGIAFALLGLLISYPLTSYFSSSESIATYENQRDLIRDLFKIQQDAQNSTGMNPAPPAESLKAQIEDEFTKAMLLPEQISSVSIAEIPKTLPKDHIENSLQVILKKLNLRQVVDLGHQMSSLHPALKMVDLSMEANAQDSRYYDVIYKFVTLKIPVYVPPPPEEDTGGKAKKGIKPKSKEPKGSDE